MTGVQTCALPIWEVIEGAVDLLPFIAMVELELSMVPLYENGPLYQEMIDRMKELDFPLFNLTTELRDPKSLQQIGRASCRERV